MEGRSYLCCAHWQDHPMKHKVDEDGNEDIDIWNSELAQDIRQSVLDGNYKYCSKKFCPHLSTLLGTGENSGWFIEKDKLPHKDFDGYVVDGKAYIDTTPSSLNFAFDHSCNYKCPSCRLDVKMAPSWKVKKINHILDYIKKNYSKDLRKVFITGSGDPFYSKSFRKFLTEFDPKLFPNMEDLHLSTNGSLFNKKSWDSIKNAHNYIKTVEISVDAASKNTYENITRLNGNWDNLIENIKFIRTLDSIEFLRFSFVVQTGNYKEMKDFAKLIYELCKDRINSKPEYKQTLVYFSKIDNWGHLPQQDFHKMAVWDTAHEEYTSFVEEVNNLYTLKNKIYIQSNFTDLLV